MALTPDIGSVEIGGDLDVIAPAEQPTRTYKIDFESGRILGFVDGLEAMRQAIYKILRTERFAYLIYSWDYGVELEALFGKSRSVAESELRRVIQEALTADSRITDISNFTVTQTERNILHVSFVAHTIFGDVEQETEVTI